MSAVSNLTYVYCHDVNSSDPQLQNGPCAFANYNEAMSFAKWASLNEVSEYGMWNVWNYNGGCGGWRNGVFTPTSNQNWP